MTVFDAAWTLFVEETNDETLAQECAEALFNAGYHRTAPGREGRLILRLVSGGMLDEDRSIF